MKKYSVLHIIFLFGFILISLLSFSQDNDLDNSLNDDLLIGQRYEPVYSQYDVNGLAINPAYTGSRECFSNIILYRNQWMGFDGTPVTQTLSSHAPFKDEKNAAGLFLFHEKIGVTDFYEIYGNYAFRFKLGTGKLSLGLKAGATIYQGNFADIKANPEGVNNDMYLENESEILPNFGVGVYYYNDRFFAGASIPKLLSYKYRASDKVMQSDPENYDFLVSAGVLIGNSDRIKFKPSFLLRYRLNNTFRIDAGGSFIFANVLWFGGSYRYDNEVVITAEYQINEQIRLGGAYDMSLGELAGRTKGSMEFILRYDFKYRIRAVSPRYF